MDWDDSTTPTHTNHPNPKPPHDPNQLLAWADEVRTMKVKANADTPEDAKKARELGAEGIGLCRTVRGSAVCVVVCVVLVLVGPTPIPSHQPPSHTHPSTNRSTCSSRPTRSTSFGV